MGIRLGYLIIAGAAAAVIAAPAAVAQNHQTCTNQGPAGTGLVCSNEGNVQVTASPQARGAGPTGFAGGFYPGGPYAVPFTH